MPPEILYNKQSQGTFSSILVIKENRNALKEIHQTRHCRCDHYRHYGIFAMRQPLPKTTIDYGDIKVDQDKVSYTTRTAPNTTMKTGMAMITITGKIEREHRLRWRC